jgi:hypothetical protein
MYKVSILTISDSLAEKCTNPLPNRQAVVISYWLMLGLLIAIGVTIAI